MRRLGLLSVMLFFWTVSNAQLVVKKTFFDVEKKKIKEEISIDESDSTLNGPYLSFYENGSLATKGFYNKDQSDSSWVFYFENGKEKASGNFHQGNQEGKWVYYFENGNKKAEGLFKDNIKHGNWVFYFENGVEKSTGIYFNGKKEGIWNYQFEEGTLKAQAYFDQGDGVYKEFYPSGKIKMEGRNVDEESQGLWTYYYESGEIEAEGTFTNGLRNGFWQHYHKNSQVEAEGNFKEGEKDGIWKYYYADGSVSSEGAMKADQQDGYWKLYYQSGIVKGEGKYDAGTGDYIEFYENGKQKARGAMKNGLKHGKWIYYNDEGVEDGKANYKNGLGDYESFYLDGTLKMEGQLENERRVGKWTLYNPDGSVAGVYRPVYEDEKPIFRTSESIKADIKKKETIDKPEYRYKSNKLRYFEPRVNEFRGYILGTNPVWIIDGKLPIAAEYYFQERLGYELQFNIQNKPFLNDADTNQVKTIGLIVDLRQKFYHQDHKLGMFYFGHQLSGGYIMHTVEKPDFSMSLTDPNYIKLKANERLFGYGAFIGNRWMQRPGNAGLTIDFHLGISVMSRGFNKEFSSSAENETLFRKIDQSKTYFPVIFGINIGFSGPKRTIISL